MRNRCCPLDCISIPNRSSGRRRMARHCRRNCHHCKRLDRRMSRHCCRVDCSYPCIRWCTCMRGRRCSYRRSIGSFHFGMFRRCRTMHCCSNAGSFLPSKNRRCTNCRRRNWRCVDRCHSRMNRWCSLARRRNSFLCFGTCRSHKRLRCTNSRRRKISIHARSYCPRMNPWCKRRCRRIHFDIRPPRLLLPTLLRPSSNRFGLPRGLERGLSSRRIGLSTLSTWRISSRPNHCSDAKLFVRLR